MTPTRRALHRCLKTMLRRFGSLYWGSRTNRQEREINRVARAIERLAVKIGGAK